MDAGRLAQIVTQGLDRATRVHDELGSAGTREIRRNPVGEMSLECDVKCEQAVLNTLREANVGGTAYTEEHGIVRLGRGRGLTVVLDGLDGTGRYKAAPGRERYSTLVAVLQGDDPVYDDYLFCAMKEHASGRLYSCSKGGGATLVESGTEICLHVAGASSLTDVTLAYIDRHWQTNQLFFERGLAEMNLSCQNASCIYYEDLASGLAQLVLECTRKRNLEMACAYGLVREAGGVMVTPDGRSLGARRYRSFAQMNDQGDVHVPIITACTQDLASQTLDQIRRRLPPPEWSDLVGGRRTSTGRLS